MKQLALAAALLALAGHAGAEEGDVRFRLVLHARYTDRENQPDPAVRFDRAALAFDVAPYLRPQGTDSYGSTFASVGADGRRGWFRWALTADTGELRESSFPRLVPVCASSLTATGLDVAGGGRCNVLVAGRRPVYTVEETRLAAAQVTSNGRAFRDELRSTLLLREAWAGAAFGQNEFGLVKVGRQRFTVADGFVYDDYGTGVQATFDLGALGPSWDLGAALFYPTRDFPRATGVTSPMLALRADYLPSLFEHAGVFLALFRDRTDSVAELFRSSSGEPEVIALQGGVPGSLAYRADERTLAAVLGSPLTSEGGLAWLGTSGSLRAGAGLQLDWTGAVVLGSVTIRRDEAAQGQASKISGQLAHLRLRGHLLRELELGGFFLFLSGDLPPAEKQVLKVSPRYGGFLGISPYVTDTNIFFNGGVAETFASRQAAAPGVNGRGVLAPGLTASWDPWRTFALDARAAYLLAPEVGPFGGRVYGPEVDLELSWSPWEWLSFVAEGDALFPGDFFPGHAPVKKLVLGIDLVGM